KAQVQHMVQRILRMEKVVRPADAADALAIAICHGWRRDGLQGASRDGTVNVSLSGKISARGALTPAQKLWAQAQAASRRTGAVDPRLRRNKSK
ncbi:crossover junction endodeoxyribonuclease RuvC, partial [Varibaculum cambriense]